MKDKNKPEAPRGPEENADSKVDELLEQAEETGQNNGSPEVSEVDALKSQLEELQAKFLYLQAEYQNFRKRSARDISDTRSRTVADTVMPFLGIADFLTMAQSAAEKSDNLEAIKQGLLMIIAQFDKTLEELDIKKFSGVGAQFDPAIHDAVGKESSDSVPEGTVIREWNCGYRIGEKLLRPARVMVSSGPAAAEEESKEE